MDRTLYFYAVTCKANGKKYIGRTFNPRIRFTQHRQALTRGKHHVPDMQEDFNKYGMDAFSFEVLEGTDDYLERHMEFDLMDLYGTGDRAKGYNYNDQHFTGTKRWVGHVKKGRKKCSSCLTD